MIPPTLCPRPQGVKELVGQRGSDGTELSWHGSRHQQHLHERDFVVKTTKIIQINNKKARSQKSIALKSIIEKTKCTQNDYNSSFLNVDQFCHPVKYFGTVGWILWRLG